MHVAFLQTSPLKRTLSASRLNVLASFSTHVARSESATDCRRTEEKQQQAQAAPYPTISMYSYSCTDSPAQKELAMPEPALM
jgi:hypothetical protein